MKTILFSLIALGVAVAMAGPADRAQAGEPMVLTDAQLDRVTAGIALLLPAVQQAPEAAKTDNARSVIIPSIAIVTPVLEGGIGDNQLFIAVGDVVR